MAQEQATKPVEEVKPEAVDEDLPELEEADGNGAEIDENVDESQLSKGEKKARKALGKMGLRQVVGARRVTLRKNKTTVFVIDNPAVYKSATSDMYIVFGEAKVDTSGRAALNLPFIPTPAPAGAQAAPKKAPAAAAPAAAASAGGAVDETGLEAKDIELVMQQAGVSREEAVNALRANKNDIVSAIMGLTGAS